MLLLTGYGFGIASLIRGCRRHSRKTTWIGGIVFLGSILVTVLLIVEDNFEGNLEYDPWIDNDAKIVGLWADHKTTLTVATNHTFTYLNAELKVTGAWTRDDWNLALNGSNFNATMRFVEYRGKYRLIPPPREFDLKMWDDLGLSRE